MAARQGLQTPQAPPDDRFYHSCLLRRIVLWCGPLGHGSAIHASDHELRWQRNTRAAKFSIEALFRFYIHPICPPPSATRSSFPIAAPAITAGSSRQSLIPIKASARRPAPAFPPFRKPSPPPWVASLGIPSSLSAPRALTWAFTPRARSLISIPRPRISRPIVFGGR